MQQFSCPLAPTPGKKSFVRLNLIDRIMLNKLTSDLFGSIKLTIAAIYMLYYQCHGAFLGDKPISFKCIAIMNNKNKCCSVLFFKTRLNG